MDINSADHVAGAAAISETVRFSGSSMGPMVQVAEYRTGEDVVDFDDAFYESFSPPHMLQVVRHMLPSNSDYPHLETKVFYIVYENLRP